MSDLRTALLGLGSAQGRWRREQSLRADIRSGRHVFRDGEPCGLHPACLSHVTKPCEECGRIAGRYPDG